jgi:fucose permease
MNTTATQSRAGSIWIHPKMLVVFGLSLFPMLAYNWMPVLFNSLEKDLHSNLEQQGSTQQFMFTAGVLLAVIGGSLTESLGLRWAPTAALAACAAGLMLSGFCKSLTVLQVGCFVYGFGALWMYLIYGVFISRYFFDERQKAFLINNVVLAAIAGSGPALLGLWIAEGFAWRAAFIALSTANVLFAVLYAWLYRDTPTGHSGRPEERTDSLKRDRNPIFTGAMWLIGTAYILHGIAEIGGISWAGKLYYQRSGITINQMALLMSAHILSFAAGRFLLTFIAGLLRDKVMLGLCTAGATLFYVLLFLARSYYMGLACMALSGLFMSGNYPAMNSLLSRRFRHRTAHAFAWYVGFGAVGSACSAPLIGVLGDRFGLARSVWLIPASSAAIAILAVAWDRLDTKRRFVTGLREYEV